jgi:hypothetical protein
VKEHVPGSRGARDRVGVTRKGAADYFAVQIPCNDPPRQATELSRLAKPASGKTPLQDDSIPFYRAKKSGSFSPPVPKGAGVMRFSLETTLPRY